MSDDIIADGVSLLNVLLCWVRYGPYTVDLIPRLGIGNPEARDACLYPEPRARAIPRRAIPRARVGPEARGSTVYVLSTEPCICNNHRFIT